MLGDSDSPPPLNAAQERTDHHDDDLEANDDDGDDLEADDDDDFEDYPSSRHTVGESPPNRHRPS